jgi:hypothetical protein
MISNFEFTHTIIYHLTSYIVIVIVIGFNFKIIIKRQIPFSIGGYYYWKHYGILLWFFIYYYSK